MDLDYPAKPGCDKVTETNHENYHYLIDGQLLATASSWVSETVARSAKLFV